MARRPLSAPPIVPLTQGPFLGMRDSLDVSSAHPKKALMLQNAYPGSPQGDGLWGRPGCVRVGGQLPGRGQRSVQFTKEDGREYTIDIAGGRLFRYDWNADAHVEISLGAYTLDPSAPIYALTFTDRLIVHDGVHKPLMLDVDGAEVWSVTELVHCPVLFGPMTRYYAKLFGIKAAERNVIVWSEENDPELGYEATVGSVTYVNAWQLTQTEEEALTALVGTEGELVFFRERATGWIRGEVSDNFQSTGVDDAYSDEIGTASPQSVVHSGRSLFLVDADGHPQVLRIGAGYVGEGGGGGGDPIWDDCRETTRRLSGLGGAQGARWTLGDLVLLGVQDYTDDYPNLILTFHARTGQFCGIWTGFLFTSLDMVKDGAGRPVLRHIDNAGWVHSHGRPQVGPWTDQLASHPEVAIVHVVEGSPTGFDTSVEKHFTQIDLSMRLTTDLTGVQVTYTMPDRGSGIITFNKAGGFSLWDVAEWDVSEWSFDSLERRVSIGISADGRWIIPRIYHNGLDEEFGLLMITLWASVIGPSHRVA